MCWYILLPWCFSIPNMIRLVLGSKTTRNRPFVWGVHTNLYSHRWTFQSSDWRHPQTETLQLEMKLPFWHPLLVSGSKTCHVFFLQKGNWWKQSVHMKSGSFHGFPWSSEGFLPLVSWKVMDSYLLSRHQRAPVLRRGLYGQMGSQWKAGLLEVIYPRQTSMDTKNCSFIDDFHWCSY